MNWKWFIPLVAVLLLSCKKYNSCDDCFPEVYFSEATIIDTGEKAADGCDWVVKTADNIYYHPDVLPAPFKINGLAITIRYQMTRDTFHCGLAGTGMPVIHVREMEK